MKRTFIWQALLLSLGVMLAATACDFTVITGSADDPTPTAVEPTPGPTDTPTTPEPTETPTTTVVPTSAPPPCGGELQTLHYDSGPATPRDGLTAWLGENYSAGIDRGFEEPGADNYFGHTVFLDGSEVLSSTVVLDVTNLHYNDAYQVGVEVPNGARTGQSLADAGVADGTRGSITITLGNDIVDDMNVKGHLDVLVQDDSTVHSVTVYLCVVPRLDCPGEILTLSESEFAASQSLADWVKANYSVPTPRGIGDTGSDLYFRTSLDFGATPRLLDAIVVAEITNEHHNDQIGIASDWTTQPKWGSDLDDVGIAVSNRATFAKSLSSLGVLEDIAKTGSFDLIVQDDSTVHSLKAHLCFAPFGWCPAEQLVLTSPEDFGSRDELAEWVAANYQGQPYRDFGESGSDRYFHTSASFGSLPLWDAYLSVQVTSGGANDTIGIGPQYPADPRWNAELLKDFGINSGSTGAVNLTLSNPAPGVVSPSGADLLTAIADVGNLDVTVQDDTTVERMELILCVGG